MRIISTTKLEGICVHDHYLNQSKNDFNHFFLHVIDFFLFLLTLLFNFKVGSVDLVN